MAHANKEGLVEAGWRIHRGLQGLLVSMVVALITNRSEQVYHYIASVTAGKKGSQTESKHLMHFRKKYLLIEEVTTQVLHPCNVDFTKYSF